MSEQVREEFNRWAAAGRGDEMEEHHLPIVLPMLALLDFAQSDRVLDIGCGSGWLCRRIATQVPEGKVVGIDVSDEMISRARRLSEAISNVEFAEGSVEKLPVESNFFEKIVSVESAYYWPDPARGVEELFRALAPGGSAWVLINYYRDNLYCHQWGSILQVPTKLLSAEEWSELFRRAGLSSVATRQIPDESPTPAEYSGRWFRDADELRRFKQAGALLITGIKSK